MDHTTQQAHRQVADPRVGHKVSKADASHDRHAGHSVAMFLRQVLVELRSHNSSGLLVD